MPIDPLSLGITGITALGSAIFGGGDDPKPYVPRKRSKKDLTDLGYKDFDAAAVKDRNAKTYSNSMAEALTRNSQLGARTGMNTNSMPGMNSWAGASDLFATLNDSNLKADQYANEQNNDLAKTIFGINAEEEQYADRFNSGLENSYNDDTFFNRFVAGAGFGSSLADQVNKWRSRGTAMRSIP